MPSDYEIDNKLKALAPVIDDHAEWFCQVNKRIFFAAQTKGEGPTPVPDSFGKWLEEAENYDFLENVTLSDLKKLFEELHIVAKGLSDKAAYGSEDDPVTLGEYDNLDNLYVNFIYKLRRLEQDCALSDSGLDIETGLRSTAAMQTDIGRELERRARGGSPITLALARIDDFENIRTNLDRESYKEVIGKVGALIKKCIRSFDDAYRLSPGEFVMSLKHTETVGGTAVVNRLRSFLEDSKITVILNNKPVALTMSYCIAEPIPGDTLASLLENMRDDLNKWDDGGNTALEYHEQSPLQRYVGDSD